MKVRKSLKQFSLTLSSGRDKNIPQKIIDLYNLEPPFDADGYIYAEIRQGMYGLPQSGILAQELLEKRLAKHGYHQSKITPGLWTQQ